MIANEQMTMEEVDGETSERDQKVAEIVAGIRERLPNVKLFEICIPGREDEIFIAKKVGWESYKRLIGSTKNEASAFEALIDKCLVYPEPKFQDVQQNWDPGLVLTLAEMIQKGLGYTKGASVKNL